MTLPATIIEKTSLVLFNGVKAILKAFGILVVCAFIYSVSYPYILKSRVNVGMTEDEVVGIVGEQPRWKQDELHYCEDGDCEAATKSGAVKFLIWKVGIDIYFFVSLDQQSKVVFRGLYQT